MELPRDERGGVERWLWPGAAGTAVLVLAWLGRGYTSDDAFIPGRYARRLVAGAGYTFRDGPATDGVTAPLLLAIEVGLARMGIDPVLGSKAIGALAAGLAASLVVRRVRARSSGRLGAPLAVAALTACAPLAMHAQSGLETGLATLLLTLTGLAASSRTARVATREIGVATGLVLVPWVRPELVPVTWALAVVLARRGPRPLDVARLARLGVAASLGLGSVIAFRLVMFGHAIPLSAQAKPTDLGNGLGYALVSLATLFGLSLVPLLHAARTTREDAALSLALLVGVVAVILGGGDWMPGARLLVPLAPLAIHLFALGAARFARTRRHPWRIAFAALALLLPQWALAVTVLRQADDVASSRAHAGVALREILARESRVVALVDVGFLAYEAPWDPFDLAGVTDPMVGTRPGPHCAKPVSVDDLLARDVDTIVLHSAIEPRVEDGAIVGMRGHPVEQALAADPAMRELFVVVAVLRWSPGYHYAVLRRRR